MPTRPSWWRTTSGVVPAAGPSWPITAIPLVSSPMPGRTPPPGCGSASPRGSRPAPLRQPFGWWWEAQHRRRRRWSVGVAGVAAAAVGLLGVGYVHTDHQVGQLRSALASSRALEQATAAALDPRARRVALTSWNGTVMAAAAVLPGGQAYLASEGLSDLPGSRTYQLWSIVDGHPVSAGVLGAEPGVSSFRVAPGASVLAITDEPAGGSPQPTGAPVASAPI